MRIGVTPYTNTKCGQYVSQLISKGVLHASYIKENLTVTYDRRFEYGKIKYNNIVGRIALRVRKTKSSSYLTISLTDKSRLSICLSIISLYVLRPRQFFAEKSEASLIKFSIKFS